MPSDKEEVEELSAKMFALLKQYFPDADDVTLWKAAAAAIGEVADHLSPGTIT